MKHVTKRTITKELMLKENSYTYFEYELKQAKLEIRRMLEKHNEDPELAEQIDVYVGGSEYCQCSGYAETINSIEREFYTDGSMSFTIKFDSDDAYRALYQDE